MRVQKTFEFFKKMSKRSAVRSSIIFPSRKGYRASYISLDRQLEALQSYGRNFSTYLLPLAHERLLGARGA